MGINAAETLYNDLNYRHFEKGQKLNDRAMLVEAAAAVGADRSDAETFLASNAGEAEIEKVKGLLSALGVNSIPTFVVGGKRLVSGAAHSADLVYAFRRINPPPLPPNCTSGGGGRARRLWLLSIPFKIVTYSAMVPQRVTN